MDQRTIQILFALLRSAICGTKLTEEERRLYSSEQSEELLEITVKHDVAHLFALGLKKNELISKENIELEKYILRAVYRYERVENEYKNLCDALEKAQIPFIPLKGSVIRKYYPEAWMRTSCDIDILVHEEDYEKAMSILINEYGYTYHGKSAHDISLFTSSKLHVEMHYDLIDEGRINHSTEVLRNVWNTAVVKKGFSFWHEMSDEMYYFYHISHMAKHFENGGCGIRPFIDLLILDNIQESNNEKRDILLSQGSLSKFANAARKLSRIWFENAEYDSISKQMEGYILQGGVYGSNENRIIVQQQKKGGRISYILSKIYIPYDVIKFHYPILQKHRWLTPIMEIRRWGKLMFCGHLKRTIKEIRYNNNITNEEAVNTQSFMNSIGLLDVEKA